MSKYTVELRYICETLTGHEMSQGFHNVEDIIHEASPQIFTTNWEIFDEDYRHLLEDKIVRHFYTREISEETYGLWRLRLDAKMCEIMPYYNQLYETLPLFKDNFWWDTDLTTERHDDNMKNGRYDTTADREKNRTEGVTFDENVKTDNTDTTDTNNLNVKKTDNVSTTDTTNTDVKKTDNTSTKDTSNKDSKITDNKTVTQTDNDTKTTSTTTTTESSTDTKSNSGRSVSRDFYSDTPQSGIAGVDTGVVDDDGNPENELDGNMYLTNYRKIKEEHADDTVDNFSGTNNRNYTGDTVLDGHVESKFDGDVEDTFTGKVTDVLDGNVNDSFTGNTKDVLDGNVTDTFTGNVVDVLDGNRDTTSKRDTLADTTEHNTINKSDDIKTLDDWIEHMYGKAPHGKTFIELLKLYRESLLNIDLMIIHDLEVLFFGLWD